MQRFRYKWARHSRKFQWQYRSVKTASSFRVPARIALMEPDCQSAHYVRRVTQHNICVDSYNPSQSSSFAQGNTSTIVTDSEGQTATASFGAESCQVASFGYDASGESPSICFASLYLISTVKLLSLRRLPTEIPNSIPKVVMVY